MQFKHTPAQIAASFDDRNLVSFAGVVPVMRLAERAGLSRLVDYFLTGPSDKGTNAGGKFFSLLAGMVCGADSIDDLSLLRHGGSLSFSAACTPRQRSGRFAGVHVRACAAG